MAKGAADTLLISMQQVHRFRSSSQLAGPDPFTPCAAVVSRRDFRMDARLSPLLRLLRMAAVMAGGIGRLRHAGHRQSRLRFLGHHLFPAWLGAGDRRTADICPASVWLSRIERPHMNGLTFETVISSQVPPVVAPPLTRQHCPFFCRQVS